MKAFKYIAFAPSFFNTNHSPKKPTTVCDFEVHMSNWVESNNPDAQAGCTLTRGPIPNVYVVEVALGLEQHSLFSPVRGNTNFSFFIINGQAVTEGYAETVLRLDGVDFSRLDDIVF
jgi:hypothetical protein